MDRVEGVAFDLKSSFFQQQEIFLIKTKSKEWLTQHERYFHQKVIQLERL